jgi:hypothetical protein
VSDRGWVILDGKVYIIGSLEDSDCYETGTRFVSLHLIEMEGVDVDGG